MKLRTLAFVSAFALLGTSCSNNEGPKDTAKDANEQKMDDTPAEKMEDDADWAVEAADGGMMEVKLGQLAQQNASSPAVKEFGRMMMTDHQKGNDELMAIAGRKNITLPAALGKEHQDKYDDLAKKQGADFDKAYTEYMVDDHEEDIDEYQKEANDGKDADLKAFAAKTVPILQHHLDMAKQARDKVK
jgi:putative membrane protein